MPTYGGYMMTVKHLLQWFRQVHPEIQVNDNYIPPPKPLFELIRKKRISTVFRVELIVLPGDTDWQGKDIDPKRMAFMFVRNICPSDRKVWLPPREIPGVASDGTAGRFLKKCGLVISDWVVINMLFDDPLASSWVTDPNASS
ncbi:unnamed protein product [Rhizoctonia solani]|uniref:Uncharacterized protein n=1 Tax=Rhizoctonia solani TaxID=456999 RepID=A0A8H3E5X0_9AGAM|nr:unnamed protein product [Rhizoctonia solani]CAE7182198.1 unnamed protein product [Rhizoctonia solani]